MSEALTIHTDGAARGNPGPAAYAYVIDLPDGTQIEEAGELGRITNNQAEYLAFVKALKHCRRLGTHFRLRFHLDSELLVKQMNGEYRVKNADLLDLYKQAKELCALFPSVEIHHVRRNQNSHADRLCNEILDGDRLSSVFAEDFIAPKDEEAAPPFPAARSTAAPIPTSPASAEENTLDGDFHEQALERLRLAASEWSRGDPNDPHPTVVWTFLWQLIQEHAPIPAKKKKGGHSAPSEG
jgi:ribonuclease HI